MPSRTQRDQCPKAGEDPRAARAARAERGTGAFLLGTTRPRVRAEGRPRGFPSRPPPHRRWTLDRDVQFAVLLIKQREAPASRRPSASHRAAVDEEDTPVLAVPRACAYARREDVAVGELGDPFERGRARSSSRYSFTFRGEPWTRRTRLPARSKRRSKGRSRMNRFERSVPEPRRSWHLRVRDPGRRPDGGHAAEAAPST
jgi:hypothetical protein